MKNRVGCNNKEVSGEGSPLLTDERAMRAHRLVPVSATEQPCQTALPALSLRGLGQGPSGARRGRRCRSQSLVRQACVIPRSAVAVTLSRAVNNIASGHAPLVSLGLRRDNAGLASLRSAPAPAPVARAPVGRPGMAAPLQWDCPRGEPGGTGARLASGQLKPALAIPRTLRLLAHPLGQSRPAQSCSKEPPHREDAALQRTDHAGHCVIGRPRGVSPLENPPLVSG